MSPSPASENSDHVAICDDLLLGHSDVRETGSNHGDPALRAGWSSRGTGWGGVVDKLRMQIAVRSAEVASVDEILVMTRNDGSIRAGRGCRHLLSVPRHRTQIVRSCANWWRLRQANDRRSARPPGSPPEVPSGRRISPCSRRVGTYGPWDIGAIPGDVRGHHIASVHLRSESRELGRES